LTEQRRRFLVSSAPALGFAVLTAALFAPVFFGGRTLVATDFLDASPVWKNPPGNVRNPYLSDSIEYYYPSEKLFSEHVRRGGLPETNAAAFNGSRVPYGAPPWASVWPVKLAFLFLLDPVRSYDFYALFHFWLAGAAFFAFLRALGSAPFAAFAGALAWVLSGRSMVWLHGHYYMPVMAYAPLAFLAARRRSLLGAIPVAGLFFSNPQIALVFSAVLVLYERSAWRAVVAGGFMAGIAVVPLAAAVSEGIRHPLQDAGYFYRDGPKTWLLPARLVVPGAFPSSTEPNEYVVYMGLVPLAGAVAGLRRDRFFALLAGVALAVATLWPIPVWLAPLSFSLPARYLFFFTLGACVLFARGLQIRPLPRWAQAAVLVLILADLAPRYVSWNGAYDPAPLHRRPPALEAVRGRAGWLLSDHPQLRRPVTPPLSLFGIDSVQGYAPFVPKAQAAAVGRAGEVAGDRLIRLTDPEDPALEALGMRTLLSDRPLESPKFRLVHEGTVRVYENPAAPEVPPRRASRAPLWIGLGVTLAGAVLAAVWGLLDRFRG
jgi:hypothetical protein